jgi:hypothetical protein
VFAGASDLSVELPLTKVGDTVSVRYDESGGRDVVDLVSFDNAELSFRSSAAQEAVRARQAEVRGGG